MRPVAAIIEPAFDLRPGTDPDEFAALTERIGQIYAEYKAAMPPRCAKPNRQERLRTVYFIQSVMGGPVKIGVSEDVHSRLRELQCGSPVELQVIGVFEGSSSDEARLHRALAKHRLHGEWFADCLEVRSAIVKETL